jgi:hypothetical protein
MKFRVFWNVLPCSQVDVDIALMMEAVRTSETLVNINLTTRQYIPEYSKLNKSTIYFTGFGRFSLQMESISLNSINFVLVKCCVFFEVRTGLFNRIYRNFNFERGKKKRLFPAPTRIVILFLQLDTTSTEVS